MNPTLTRWAVNQARAMRVAEIVTDYRNIQTRISQIRASPTAEEYNEVGFALLRQCESEAREILAQPFPTDNNTARDEEQIKQQLRRIIIDSAVRRFRVQKIFLRMSAALSWISKRTQVLQGSKPSAQHAAALNAITQALRQDLISITDARIEASLRDIDTRAGKWVLEDPPLTLIQRLVGA
ncbi:hypothetical protein AMS68_000764 [Peltaster fructicola]|uniref:Uncharacterized protein n=1 Tax=Peltaster fructicola TaxID=286661 RepID=A0A6H0XKH8_9PEZI|nr:hypothetical protein AMS68_000764 [Peltaster fructicola]